MKNKSFSNGIRVPLIDRDQLNPQAEAGKWRNLTAPRPDLNELRAYNIKENKEYRIIHGEMDCEYLYQLQERI